MKTRKVKAKPSASKKATVANESELQFVPLDHLQKHPEIEYRGEDEEFIKHLVTNIGDEGLNTPITTWAGEGKSSKYKVGETVVDAQWIISGEQRTGALLRLRKANPSLFAKRFPKGIPVYRIHGSKIAAISAVLRTNLDTNEMDPGEIYPLLNQLVEEGVSQRAIAKSLGKTESWISQLLAVQEELPEDVMEDVKSGDVALQDARKVAKESRRASKAGKPMSTAAKKEKLAAAANEVKRVPLKVLFDAYQKMPDTALTRKVTILETIIAYNMKTTSKLPREITSALKAAKKSKLPASKATTAKKKVVKKTTAKKKAAKTVAKKAK